MSSRAQATRLRPCQYSCPSSCVTKAGQSLCPRSRDEGFSQSSLAFHICMASLILTTPKGGQRSRGKSPNWGGVWRELWEEMGGPGKPQSGIQLPFYSLFLSLRRSSSPSSRCLCRQRAEPRAVTRRRERFEGPVGTKQDSVPGSPQDWGRSEDGENKRACFLASPMRSGWAWTTSKSPPPPRCQDSPLSSHGALSPHRALGAVREEALHPKSPGPHWWGTT